MGVREIDVEWVRAQFPALQQLSVGDEPAVFFDGPGGTQVPSSVIGGAIMNGGVTCGGCSQVL